MPDFGHGGSFAGCLRACLPRGTTIDKEAPALTKKTTKVPPTRVQVCTDSSLCTDSPLHANVLSRTGSPSRTVLPVEYVVKCGEALSAGGADKQPPQVLEVELLDKACSPAAAAPSLPAEEVVSASSNGSPAAAVSVSDGISSTVAELSARMHREQQRYVDAVISGELWEPLEQLAALRLPSDEELATSACAACAVRSGCVRLLRTDFPIIAPQHAQQESTSLSLWSGEDGLI